MCSTKGSGLAAQVRSTVPVVSKQLLRLLLLLHCKQSLHVLLRRQDSRILADLCCGDAYKNMCRALRT
jgi:hypothetical protein